MAERPYPQPGDHAPYCYGSTGERHFYSSDDQYGRPAIMLLAGTLALPGLRDVLDGLCTCIEPAAARRADIILLTEGDPRRAWPNAPAAPNLRVVDCPRFLDECGVGPTDAIGMVIDRNQRVALRARPGIGFAEAALASLDSLPFETATDQQAPAPVLLLPNLLARAQCRALIALFDDGESMEGEVARLGADGRPINVVDHAKKCRRDFPITPGSAWHATLGAALLARAGPEITKAFQSRVAHTDRILIARYDSSGGWFRRHRDNASPEAAFREFALSVNLNADVFAGGHLWFPEYNDHRYSPPTGGGLIFSTSLLHEACPVTDGARYVLLTFFHGEAAEQRRLARLANKAPA